MPEKKSQYDTDPLDPNFARDTEEVWGATRLIDPATAPVEQQRYHPESEAPTRRIDDNFAQSYPSVFTPPAAYQPPPAAAAAAPRPAYAQPPQTQGPAVPPGHYAPPAAQGTAAPPRNVAGLGIPERFANTLPYAPFYIGLIASIIELLVVPRAEVRTRFHAAQGMALQLGILAFGFVLGILTGIGGFRAGSIIFSLASFAFLVHSMFRVWNGREHRLAPLEDAARFLNERIDPRK